MSLLPVNVASSPLIFACTELVAGAGGVLGRGESVAFAKAGATLALLDIPRAEAGLQQTISECEAEGAKAKGYYCNVTDEKASAETLAKIESELGPVDVLLNNAGGCVVFFNEVSVLIADCLLDEQID